MERDENYVPRTRTELAMAPKQVMKTKDYLEIFEEVGGDLHPTCDSTNLSLHIIVDSDRHARPDDYHATPWLELVSHVQLSRLTSLPSRN